MMIKILKIQLFSVLLLSSNIIASTQSDCDELTACKKKICYLEKDLTVAKKMENNSRVKGLEIALEKVNKYCTDDKLLADLEEKIKDTKKDLQEDTEDYEKALKENRPDKVAKYKTKILEETKNINRLEKELKGL